MMAITFNLPDDVERSLREEYPDLNQAAKEAFVIEAYRTGRITAGDVAVVLGLETSLEALDWLRERGIHLNYGMEELEADWRTAEALMRKKAS
jgi:predicted HTH domain antitoxin